MATPTRRRPTGIVAIAVITVISVVATLALTVSPVAAHPKLSPRPSCPGGEVGHYDLYGEDVTLSLFVYYSSANGGTNCAWVQKESNAGRGSPDWMWLKIARCATDNPARCGVESRRDYDYGEFRYYAGPVISRGTANRCIRIVFAFRDFGQVTRGPFHCG